MKLLLIALLYGLIWAWRGWDKPKFIHGYFRAFITSFVLIGTYYGYTGGTIFCPNGILALVTLTLIESLLGYGETCEVIDINKGSFLKSKEDYTYLGLVSYFYYMLPLFLISNQVFNLTIISGTQLVISFLAFPVFKYLQVKVTKFFKEEEFIFIFDTEIRLDTIDTWKLCVEFPIGMLFILWYV